MVSSVAWVAVSAIAVCSNLTLTSEMNKANKRLTAKG